MLVFVEVKARRSGSFGGATAAVGFQKQRRLINMARSYLMGIGGKPPPCRFDVVGVTVAEGERPVLDVVVNAFVVRSFRRGAGLNAWLGGVGSSRGGRLS